MGEVETLSDAGDNERGGHEDVSPTNEPSVTTTQTRGRGRPKGKAGVRNIYFNDTNEIMNAKSKVMYIK